MITISYLLDFKHPNIYTQRGKITERIVKIQKLMHHQYMHKVVQIPNWKLLQLSLKLTSELRKTDLKISETEQGSFPFGAL